MKKNILIVQYYFYPDMSAVSQLLSELLPEVSNKTGHNISVLCARSSYTDKSRQYSKTDLYKGIRINRIRTLNLGKASLIKRAFDYFIFYMGVYFRILFSRKWDIIISMTSPPLIGNFVALAKLCSKKTKIINYIEDLYPEILYDMDYIKRPWLIRKISRINQIIYRRADAIITLGKYMSKKIENYNKAFKNKIRNN